jgi:DNA (cytosine-5)-methyltransferase 1
MNRVISAVDLFCGVGGLTRGLIEAGIFVKAGIDIDDSCKYAYTVNNGTNFIHKDIANISVSELRNFYLPEDIKVLAGCAPCQPFSRHTQKYKNRREDGRWQLLTPFGNLIEGLIPDIVSMENVPELENEDIFHEFTDRLESMGYHIFWKPVYCPDYGIPQTRTRLVLLASLLGDISIIPKTHDISECPTVGDVIRQLPPLKAGECSATDKLHKAQGLTEVNLNRIKRSKPGGTWLDWDEALRAPCHKKESGKSYSSVYSRMSWDGMAPTITTEFFNFGAGRFGHPEQDRAISLREGALFQTFPADYDFIDPDTTFAFDRIGRHIGNAVPVRLGTVIGESIQMHIGRVFDER